MVWRPEFRSQRFWCRCVVLEFVEEALDEVALAVEVLFARVSLPWSADLLFA